MDVAFLKLSPAPSPPTLPAAPDWRLTVHGRPFQDDFEESYGEWHRLGGPDGAALLLDRTTPASGHASLRLLNQRVGGPAGAWITRTPFRLDAFPTLTFQARIPAGIEINLIVIANQQTLKSVDWGDKPAENHKSMVSSKTIPAASRHSAGCPLQLRFSDKPSLSKQFWLTVGACPGQRAFDYDLLLAINAAISCPCTAPIRQSTASGRLICPTIRPTSRNAHWRHPDLPRPA